MAVAPREGAGTERKEPLNWQPAVVSDLDALRSTVDQVSTLAVGVREALII